MLTNRIGQVYGRLTVIERTVCPKRFASAAYRRLIWWKCLCECSNEHITAGFNFDRGKVLSCGCLQRENGLRTVAAINARSGHRPWTEEETSALWEAKARGDNVIAIAQQFKRTPGAINNKWWLMGRRPKSKQNKFAVVGILSTHGVMWPHS